MSEEKPQPSEVQWGRPLRKKSRGPVAVPPPSSVPAVGPVDSPAPTRQDQAEELLDEPGALGAGMSEPPETPGPIGMERAPAAPRAARAASEPDAEDLRERDLAAFMARGLVDHPDDVSVEILTPGPDACYELHTHPDDLGHVIGKQGRTARSLRLALGASAGRVGRRADLEIAD